EAVTQLYELANFMLHSYKHGKSMRRYRRAASKTRFFLALSLLMIALLVAGAVLFDIRSSSKAKPLNSKAEIKAVTGSLQTFYAPYFRFQDTGKWVLNSKESSNNKYVYHKYHGLQIQNQLIVYINQVPIPLHLAVSRALPVRLVNGSSFDVTSVSGHCGLTY